MPSAPNENSQRLAAVVKKVTGMDASIDGFEAFPQAACAFSDDAAFAAFVERSGSADLKRLAAMHRQQSAYVALKAVYADLGDSGKCQELSNFFNNFKLSLSERQEEIARQRKMLAQEHTDSLYRHLCKVIKSFRPSLKISYDDGAICAYVLSLLLPEPVESMTFKADIGDESGLEKAVRAAMADLAPLADEYKSRR